MAQLLDRILPAWTPRLNVLLPSIYAWAATVAFPVVSEGVSWTARASAMGALIALGYGVLGHRSPEPKLRFLRASGFFALSGVTWVLVGPDRLARLEPLQAAFGALGWALCAFGWGTVRNVSLVPEEAPRAVHGVALIARRRPPVRATAYFLLSVTCAGIIFIVPRLVVRPAVATLAQLIALGAAAWTLLAGTRLAFFAAYPGAWAPAGARLHSATRPLALLAVVLMVGLLARALLR